MAELKAVAQVAVITFERLAPPTAQLRITGFGAVADQAIVAEDLRIFIDLTVTVIIDAVASFRRGQGATARRPEAIDALLDASLTGADVRGAFSRSAILALAATFVDLAIAVVVDVVIAVFGRQRADRWVGVVAVLG